MAVKPHTVTVTTARPGITRIRVGDRIFPVGESVSDVPKSTVEALEAMPGVTVEATGNDPDPEPAPEPPEEE